MNGLRHVLVAARRDTTLFSRVRGRGASDEYEQASPVCAAPIVMGGRMAKTTKLRPWTKDDVRTLKTLAREKAKTTVIAR
jgi:hypothetical protein